MDKTKLRTYKIIFNTNSNTTKENEFIKFNKEITLSFKTK